MPTLRHLLEPAAQRPRAFYRGNDVYDAANVGFAWETPEIGSVKFHRYDTQADGNSNAGHEGAAYGTNLPAADKAALLEHLKTF